MGERLCSVDGCGRKHKSKGFCDKHYQMLRLHGDPHGGKYENGKRKPPGGNPLLVECIDCGTPRVMGEARARHSSGYCRSCAAKQRQRQKVLLICLQCGALEEAERCRLGIRLPICYRCSTRNNARVQREKTLLCLPCRNCSWPCTMSPSQLRVWEGHCRVCALVFRGLYMSEEKRQRYRALAREQVKRQGGIPGGEAFRIKGGSEHPDWKGGITDENHRIRKSDEYVTWALAVKQRDGFKCQDCGTPGGPLASHHLLSFADYPEKRFDVDNGITVCKSCHAKRHRPILNRWLKKK